MQVFDLQQEQEFDPAKHVEKILGEVGPYHCHPHATEIYYCVSGGGKMRTPERTIDVVPGAFVVHPRGELHEYINGAERTLLFRVRYGDDMSTRHMENRQHQDWSQQPEDADYFRANPALMKS